jgi:lipopolysaccharide biosynthesis protein
VNILIDRIAVVVHVYYQELWLELADCIRRVDVPYDLFITYSDERSVAKAKLDFPGAIFVQCENKGYDIWPFLKILNILDLKKYTHIIKLHTKRDILTEGVCQINSVDLRGNKWRKRLLSFISSKNAWKKTKRKINENGSIGMIADPFLLFKRKDVKVAIPTFDNALGIVKNLGFEVNSKKMQYVGGTMFMARAECFSSLRGEWNADDFDYNCSHADGSLAHCIERALCFCVYGSGYVISYPFDLIVKRKIRALEKYRRVLRIFARICRLFYQRKITIKGYVIIKVLKIPIAYFKSGESSKNTISKSTLISMKKMSEIIDWYDASLHG